VSIDTEEYERISSQRFRNNWGAPYSFAIQMLMLLVYMHLSERGKEDQVVNFLIEDGHSNIGQAMEIIGKSVHSKNTFIRLGSLEKGGKLNNPILQAADLLAYAC